LRIKNRKINPVHQFSQDHATMIRSPLGLRLDPSGPIRDQIRGAARMGSRGVVIDAVGDLAPDRLSETGRRELRHLLRSVELAVVALHLPTRRAFDTDDQLEDRLRRADRAFVLAFELGAGLVLARVGGIPPESAPVPRETFLGALRELDQRADHRGVRLTVETGPDPGEHVRALLDSLDRPNLAASIDPAALLENGHDPIAATRALGRWVAHAYATGLTPSSRVTARVQRSGFPTAGLDWEEYLGSLEEIDYVGYLTVWPEPTREPAAQFKAVVDRSKGF
jgi:sugar phosphate isomerase/epimerase